MPTQKEGNSNTDPHSPRAVGTLSLAIMAQVKPPQAPGPIHSEGLKARGVGESCTSGLKATHQRILQAEGGLVVLGNCSEHQRQAGPRASQASSCSPCRGLPEQPLTVGPTLEAHGTTTSAQAVAVSGPTWGQSSKQNGPQALAALFHKGLESSSPPLPLAPP